MSNNVLSKLWLSSPKSLLVSFRLGERLYRFLWSSQRAAVHLSLITRSPSTTLLANLFSLPLNSLNVSPLQPFCSVLALACRWLSSLAQSHLFHRRLLQLILVYMTTKLIPSHYWWLLQSKQRITIAGVCIPNGEDITTCLLAVGLYPWSGRHSERAIETEVEIATPENSPQLSPLAYVQLTLSRRIVVMRIVSS